MIDDALLERIPLLAGLAVGARRPLARGAVRRRYLPDETLFTAGTVPPGLFIVLDGEVRVVRATAGRQHVVHTERAGGTLAELPIFGGGPVPATAVASSPTDCLLIPTDALWAAIAADPALARRCLARIAERVRGLVERLDRATARSVPARLAALLLDRAARAAPGRPLTLGATQARVAEEIGTVREVVVRALRELARAGAIRPEGRGRYRVVDEALLRRIADGER